MIDTSYLKSKGMRVKTEKLVKDLNELLQVSNFQDYGPNGLQISGKEECKKILFSVSATLASIEKAKEINADMLLVHHGLFWKFHPCPRPIIGPYGERVKKIITGNINLVGYHLPLDGHLELGHAAMLAKKLEVKNLQPFGLYKGAYTGASGAFTTSISPKELEDKLKNILQHSIMVSSPVPAKKIKTIGIITGGASGGWAHCYEAGIDAYVTGELSEHDWHDAKEHGIHLFAGGHNATEELGVLALMEYVQKTYNLDCHFFKSDNPA